MSDSWSLATTTAVSLNIPGAVLTADSKMIGILTFYLHIYLSRERSQINVIWRENQTKLVFSLTDLCAYFGPVKEPISAAYSHCSTLILVRCHHVAILEEHSGIWRRIHI